MELLYYLFEGIRALLDWGILFHKLEHSCLNIFHKLLCKRNASLIGTVISGAYGEINFKALDVLSSYHIVKCFYKKVFIISKIFKIGITLITNYFICFCF